MVTARRAVCSVHRRVPGIRIILLGTRFLLGRSSLDLDLLPFGPRGANQNFFHQPTVLGNDLPDHNAVDRAASMALAVVDGHHALAHSGAGLDVVATGLAKG